MHPFMKVIVATLVSVGLLLQAAPGKGATAMEAAPANPHGDPESCGVCHILPKEKLEGLFTSSSLKRQLRSDLVNLCRGCHGVGFGHGVGKKPEMNIHKLPLADDGTITCAITCHDMHIKNPADQEQEHYHLRLPVAKICFSCHDK